jgi:hypothetical protein
MNTIDLPSLCRWTFARCYTTRSVIREHKNYYPLIACCITVRRLHRHPLLTRCIAVRRLHRHPLFVRCIAMRRLPGGPPVCSLQRYPLVACCVAVLSHCLRDETPRLAACPPIDWLVILRAMVLYVALAVIEHSLCCSYSSGRDWYGRMLYSFFLPKTREVLVVPFNTQALTSAAGLGSEVSQVAYW